MSLTRVLPSCFRSSYHPFSWYLCSPALSSLPSSPWAYLEFCFWRGAAIFVCPLGGVITWHRAVECLVSVSNCVIYMLPLMLSYKHDDIVVLCSLWPIGGRDPPPPPPPTTSPTPPPPRPGPPPPPPPKYAHAPHHSPLSVSIPLIRSHARYPLDVFIPDLILVYTPHNHLSISKLWFF